MNSSFAPEHRAAAITSISAIRRRLYGLCVVVALAILMTVHVNNGSSLSVSVYVPLVVATMLAIGLAGAEWQVFLQRHENEIQTQREEQDRSDQQDFERKRSFNRLWQTLADSHGRESIPIEIMQQLSELFRADLIAVWSAVEPTGGYRLRGTQPADSEISLRLDKLGRATPCFERLRGAQRAIPVTDFVRDTAPALALFCEQRELQQAVLCPVLVRQELVGVLAFFFRQPTKVSAKAKEEMQAAANLFLCAL